jgi:hypothetical protein
MRAGNNLRFDWPSPIIEHLVGFLQLVTGSDGSGNDGLLQVNHAIHERKLANSSSPPARRTRWQSPQAVSRNNNPTLAAAGVNKNLAHAGPQARAAKLFSKYCR